MGLSILASIGASGGHPSHWTQHQHTAADNVSESRRTLPSNAHNARLADRRQSRRRRCGAPHRGQAASVPSQSRPLRRSEWANSSFPFRSSSPPSFSRPTSTLAASSTSTSPAIRMPNSSPSRNSMHYRPRSTIPSALPRRRPRFFAVATPLRPP